MEVKNQSLCEQYPVLYQNRYCYQEDVDVIIFKRNSVTGYVDELLKIKGMNFSTYKCVPMREVKRYFGKAVIGQDIYVVNRHNSSRNFGIVQTYSTRSDNWKTTTELLDIRHDFCVCSFKQNLFLIGGIFTYKFLNECLEYDVNDNEWGYIANMNEGKGSLACTVFDGKIVISGGFRYESLNSVEAYDHHEDEWTFLPDMQLERCGHSAVSMGKKNVYNRWF